MDEMNTYGGKNLKVYVQLSKLELNH